MHRSGSSTPGSAGSPSPGRSRTSCRNESILYVGDLEHSPYGPKKIADVRGYALAVLDDLVAQGVKMLVIACNTASAAMLRDARERYDVPGRRGDPAGRAPRGARRPATAGSA